MDNIIEEEDYRDLQRKYTLLEKELDRKNQKLHDCQRKLKESEAIRFHELEVLQAELDSCNSNKLTLQISQLKETILELRSANAKSTNSFINEVTTKDLEITNLKKEINEYKSKNEPEYSVKDDAEIFEELSELRKENDNLRSRVEELQDHLNEVGDHILRLEEELNVCREDLEETKECLSVKTISLKEAHEVIDKINDELKCTKNELDSLINKPLDLNSKGNSIFAEVDDRRKYLQKTIDTMKADYIAMKQERYNHLKQIAHLRREINDISRKYKDDIEQIEIDKFEIEKAVKERIEILEKLLESSKQEKKQKEKSDNLYEELQYLSNIIKEKDQQIEQMEQKLSSQAFNHVLLSKALAEANNEKRKWRRELTLLRNERDLDEAEKSVESNLPDKKWQQIYKGPILPDLNTLKKEREVINLYPNTPSQHPIFQNSKKLYETMSETKKLDHIENKCMSNHFSLKKQLIEPTKPESLAVSLQKELENSTNKENEAPLDENASIKIENDSVQGSSTNEVKLSHDETKKTFESLKPSKSVSFANGEKDSAGRRVNAGVKRIPKIVIKSNPVHFSTKNISNNT